MSAGMENRYEGFPSYDVGDCAPGSLAGHAPAPFLEADGRGHNRCNLGGITVNKGSTTNLGTNAGGSINTSQTQWGALGTEVATTNIVCVDLRGKAQLTDQNWFCAPSTEHADAAQVMANNHKSLPQIVLAGQNLVAQTNMHQ
jgi:hypothetical protein